MGILPVRTDVPQKASDDTDPGSGLGHDLAASVETTYSEQSSSSLAPRLPLTSPSTSGRRSGIKPHDNI